MTIRLAAGYLYGLEDSKLVATAIPVDVLPLQFRDPIIVQALADSVELDLAMGAPRTAAFERGLLLVADEVIWGGADKHRRGRGRPVDVLGYFDGVLDGVRAREQRTATA